MDIDVMLEKILQNKQKKIDDFMIEQLKHVHPKIKGEITRGKLKWRGIRLGVQDTIGAEKRYFLIQRGVEIGDSLVL